MMQTTYLLMCAPLHPQNPLLDGGDLSTGITYSAGDGGFDEFGKPIYRNRKQVGIAYKALNEPCNIPC